MSDLVDIVDVVEPAVVEVAAPISLSANGSSRGLVRNALTGYLSTFVGMATGFLLTPFLLHHLGSDRYGLWMLLNSAIGYVGLVELGIGTAVAKRVSECLATQDRGRLERVLGTAFALYLVIALAVMMVTAVLMLFVGRMFHLSGEDLRLARGCLFVLGINQAINFLFTSQSAILFGSGRMDLMTGVGIIVSVASSVAQVVLLIHGGNIVALAWVAVATTITTGYLGYHVIKKKLPDSSVRLRAATTGMARELMKFGSRNAAVAVCGMIAFGSDALIIGLMLPLSNVAAYVIAAKLVALVRTLATKPIDVCMPAYSHSHVLGDTERQFQLFCESVMLTLGLTLPAVIVIVAFSDRIISAWVGPGHAEVLPIVAVLALALALQLPGHACFSILTGTENNVLLIKVGIVSAATNLALSITLTRLLGPVGVAYGTLLTVAIADFIVLPRYVCGLLGYRYETYINNSFRPLLLPSIASGVLLIVLKSSGLPGGTPVMGLLAGSVVCIFWIVFVGFGSVRRTNYFRKIHRALIN